MGTTKARKEAPTPRPKRVKKGSKQNSCIDNNCSVDGSVNELNPQEIDLSKLAILKVGELRSKILIGFYYFGGSKVSDLKLDEHKRQTKEESALNLVKNGYLHKEGSRYNLTEEGMNLVKPFINYFRDKHAVV